MKTKLRNINVADVITWNPQSKIIYLGKNLLTEKEIQALKEEARYIKATRLWQIMTDTLGNTARETMFEKAKDFDDMKTGKAILYAIDVQEKILNIFDK